MFEFFNILEDIWNYYESPVMAIAFLIYCTSRLRCWSWRSRSSFLNAIPGCTFIVPAYTDQSFMLLLIGCVIVITASGIGIVFTVQYDSLIIIAVPADSFISPSCFYQRIFFCPIDCIVMLSAVFVIETVYRSL